MRTQKPYLEHAKAALVLGLPLIGSHVAQVGISLTDSVMLGWYDIESLAAQVLGSTLFFVLFIMGSGFAFAVMPMVAQAEGAGNNTQVRRVTRMGLWASIMFAVLAMPLMLGGEGVLSLLGQTDVMAAQGGVYLQIASWGIFPALMVMVLKSFLAALERTQIVLWVTLGAVAANILVNYALIFGNWGAPELGIRGAAYASVIVQFISLVCLAAYVAMVAPEHALFQRFWRPDWAALGEVFRLGWPIGITNLAEVGLFAAASVMMGWLGTVELAAHGIALQISSLTFMVHLGLSNAATVRAGRALGRGDPVGLKLGAQTIVALSFFAAAVTVFFFLAIPEVLLGAFLAPDDPQRDIVIAAGVSLLAAAALFQLTDGAQVMALGLLRGVQDTRVPMVIAALSYWVVGVPCSYVLGFMLGWGGVGVWLGLALGLALAGVFMSLRFWRSTLPKIEAEQA